MFGLKKIVQGTLAGVILAGALAQGAMAAQVAGMTYPDTVKLAGKELQLNGLGVRSKFFIKLYTAGLYLPSKKTTVEEVIKTDGPRRMQLQILRDISGDDFGSAFMAGINANVSKEEKTRIVAQISQFGQIFAMMPGLKKGDVLDLDWVPGTGTIAGYNGKPIGEVMPGIQFHNAVLKIWLGDKPADATLKPLLLGGK
ncbi:chalcone isomerase family protein [Massilia sp. PAMC28688]|uniref:chalcone isomerase family protein n=1 Tax=Massilia sp. PAMC28688 TaxID=2861283 RepID=UPI001C628AEE|nr:chalcone isomerase family protein [Massilia sp. PAMC28688]QYF95199.1 chalcone isomerase family protein [Massilia sp. PAMC28688]